MNKELIKQNKIFITLGSFIIVLVLTLREYFYGGVITHHLLAREDLPGFSNWWGLLSVPLLTWIVLYFILRRKSSKEKITENNYSPILINFIGALVLGLSMSILWEFRMEAVLQYLILLPLAISIFKPVYFPECLLGFVLGMLYAFGGILPIIIGTVLMILCFLIYQIIHKGAIWLFSKIR